MVIISTDRPWHPWRWLVGIVVVAALLWFTNAVWVIAPSLFGPQWEKMDFTHPPDLPPAADVQRVTVQTDFKPGTWHDRFAEPASRPIRFAVPREYIPRLLGLLAQGGADPNAAKWMIMADIRFTPRTGRGFTFDINLYFGDGKRAAFKVRETYFRGATDADFEQLLDEAYFASRKTLF